MKEKWMKFFRIGSARPPLNTDRVLKNSVDDTQVEFINDQMLAMNDLQLIRSVYILRSSHKMVDTKIKDRALRLLMSNIEKGRFEMKKGNNLVAFAQMINHNYGIWFANTKDVRLSVVEQTVLQGWLKDVLPVAMFNSHHYVYETLTTIAKHFVPFYKYYFNYYKPSQKLVSLRFLQSFNIYDKELYDDLVRDIEMALKPMSKAAQIKNLETICQAQDPITNEKIDRFFELLAVMDFQKKTEMEASDQLGSKKNAADMGLSEAAVLKLAQLTLNQVEREPNLTLNYHNRPSEHFDPDLRYLFSASNISEGKTSMTFFYDKVLDSLLAHLK